MYINRLNKNLKDKYGCKVYKLSLSSGCSCPNRDGTLGTRGCIFCDGSGSFAQEGSITEQIERAKLQVAKKVSGEIKYIAYFQPFTNTYADPQKLKKIFFEAAAAKDVVAVSIATRPDCLGKEILELLCELNKIIPVWVELGLQTSNEKTAEYIRRSYKLSVYELAVENLKKIGVTVITHMIIGLPGESRKTIVETARYIGLSGADGIKFHLLYVIRGTDLEKEWLENKFETLSMEDYISILCECIENIPRKMVIHRMTGDGDKKKLLAPLWSGNKKVVLNSINRALKDLDFEQGRKFESSL